MLGVIKAVADKGFEVHDDWPDPTVNPGEVVIEVAAASLCGTDREVYEWTPSAQAFNLDLPVVPGHEGAGTILEVGQGVTGLRVGDRVALESHLICGQCYPCRTGNAHTCERTGIIGMHIDGVFAERIAVPEASACPCRTPPWRSAPCSSQRASPCTPCNGPATPWQARTCWSTGAVRWGSRRPDRGGHGRSHTSSPSSPTPTAANRPRTSAPACCNPATVVDLCRDLAGARGGFDVAFEVSGVRGVLPALFAALRREATLVTVGHPSAPVEIDIAAYINKRASPCAASSVAGSGTPGSR